MPKPTGRKFNMKERKEEVDEAIRTGDWRGIPPLLRRESDDEETEEPRK